MHSMQAPNACGAGEEVPGGQLTFRVAVLLNQGTDPSKP